ncbi:hypothetical protein HaLaN_28602 [Haematococcus lacustris]|uniref:Uncharacterized protein n=1 Tax=Haematococcus lacustris TaxID=44745 RepID=A0A6A0AC14_HAELA|nr:hypothetical protein HaLaN_28602 [Haematococcus lacustris]
MLGLGVGEAARGWEGVRGPQPSNSAWATGRAHGKNTVVVMVELPSKPREGDRLHGSVHVSIYELAISHAKSSCMAVWLQDSADSCRGRCARATAALTPRLFAEAWCWNKWKWGQNAGENKVKDDEATEPIHQNAAATAQLESPAPAQTIPAQPILAQQEPATAPVPASESAAAPHAVPTLQSTTPASGGSAAGASAPAPTSAPALAPALMALTPAAAAATHSSTPSAAAAVPSNAAAHAVAQGPLAQQILAQRSSVPQDANAGYRKRSQVPSESNQLSHLQLSGLVPRLTIALICRSVDAQS